MQHVDVYRREGRYCGWPANYGIWNWDDEIVVGFVMGYHAIDEGAYAEAASGSMHAADRERPWTPMQARSTDGGLTWTVRSTPCRRPGDRNLSADEHLDDSVGAELHVGEALDSVNAPVEHPGGIDFAHPDFALMCARTGIGSRNRATSWFYASDDRCRSWTGPYDLPHFGYDHVAARTDYLPLASGECLLFLTVMDGPPIADREDVSGSEIPHSEVICVRTDDWGRSFEQVGTVCEGAIMPASVRLDDGRLLTAVRHDRIDLHASDDGGATWERLATPVADTGRGGNPPTLTRLDDDRLCLTYGYRAEPYGIRARLSDDGGATWSDDVVLRDDGGNRDLGYPRTAQRADGNLITAYYFNDRPAGERYVAATVWDPDAV